MKRSHALITTAAFLMLAGCASVDRPVVTFKDSPNDNTKERVYAWTPGTAAAIGVDQYGATDAQGRPKKDGVKFCVLTAATARTAAISANAAIEAPGAKLAKIGAATQQSYGAVILKNESAAATFLDVGMFHICMLGANVDGPSTADIKEMTMQLMRSAVEVSKSSLQWVPIGESKPEAESSPPAQAAQPPATGASK